MKQNTCGRACKLSIFFVIFLDMLGVGIVVPVLASLFLDPLKGILPSTFALSLKTLLYGLLIAAYPFMQFFGAPILGAMSDRYGRKKVLLVSIAGTLIGDLIFALGIMLNSIVLLFIGRIIDGLTGGNISVALSAIADVSDEKSKARNFGMVGMAFGFGLIIGPYIGGLLANPAIVHWFTSATPFWFAAILTVVNIVLLVCTFPETLLTRIESKISLLTGFRNISKAFKLSNMRVMFLVIFLLAFGFNFFTQFVQVYLIEKFQYTEFQIGNFFAFIGFWIAFAQGVVTRPVSKHFSPDKVLRFAPLLLGMMLALLLLPTKPVYLYFILPFVAIFQGLTFPNSTAIISNLSSRDSQGEIMGINQSIQSLAQTIPPIIAGLISSISFSLPIIVASIITIIAWLIFMIFYGRKKEEAFHEV